jgi:hypothetical protein
VEYAAAPPAPDRAEESMEEAEAEAD